MTAPARQEPARRAIAVGALTDGYRVDRILSVRSGRHTLAEATSPEGERVLLQLCETSPAEKGLRRRAARLAGTRRSIAHGHLLPLVGNGSTAGDLCWGALPAGAVTLAEKLGSGPLEREWVVATLSQVAGALDTAGRQGLVPRSLTPSDILVTDTEPPRALLADVGINIPDVPVCRYRFSVEDADYLSPEEIRGEEPTSESSVYSLGCILVHCLTGAPPFPFDRLLLALHAHQVEEPPRVSERAEQLPPKLDRVLGRALSKEPRRRQQTPAALMRGVQDALRVRAPIPVRGRGSVRPEPLQAPEPAGPRQRPARGRRARQAPTPAPPAPKRAPAPARFPDPGPAPWAAEAPARRRRPDSVRPARRPRPRIALRVRIPRAALTWSSLALMASAVAGFAAGSGGAEDAVTPAASRQAPSPAVKASGPAVSPVVGELQSRRVTLRRQLRGARKPEEQLEAVRALQSAYGRAQVSLRRDPGRAPLEVSLLESLSEVEDAYADLATAASRRSPRAWQRARGQVGESERDLELLLRSERWI